MAKLQNTRKQHIKVNETQLEMMDSYRAVAPITDDFEGKLVAAQQQLEQLQHQQEVVERQKRELQELTERKEEFLEGQISITERLTGTITAVDRELFDMRQEMEDLEQTRKCFADHLQKIDGINHDSWSKDDLKHELNRAISMLDHAEDEFDEALAYFTNSSHSNVFGGNSKPSKKSSAASKSGSPKSEFQAMLKQGLAFNMPIFVIGLLALIAYVVK